MSDPESDVLPVAAEVAINTHPPHHSRVSCNLRWKYYLFRQLDFKYSISLFGTAAEKRKEEDDTVVVAVLEGQGQFRKPLWYSLEILPIRTQKAVVIQRGLSLTFQVVLLESIIGVMCLRRSEEREKKSMLLENHHFLEHQHFDVIRVLRRKKKLARNEGTAGWSESHCSYERREREMHDDSEKCSSEHECYMLYIR